MHCLIPRLRPWGFRLLVLGVYLPHSGGARLVSSNASPRWGGGRALMAYTDKEQFERACRRLPAAIQIPFRPALESIQGAVSLCRRPVLSQRAWVVRWRAVPVLFT